MKRKKDLFWHLTGLFCTSYRRTLAEEEKSVYNGFRRWINEDSNRRTKGRNVTGGDLL